VRDSVGLDNGYLLVVTRNRDAKEGMNLQGMAWTADLTCLATRLLPSQKASVGTPFATTRLMAAAATKAVLEIIVGMDTLGYLLHLLFCTVVALGPTSVIGLEGLLERLINAEVGSRQMFARKGPVLQLGRAVVERGPGLPRRST
jgi:hypothetical protein